MMAIAGACAVALGEAAPLRAEAGAGVRIPPGATHRVTSLGPEDRQPRIVCSPPPPRRG